MTFLKRLAAGQIALWCVFWLIGTPLSLVWDASGACMITGCGVEDAVLIGVIIGLFALASLAIPFVAVAIWKSASNYPRKVWWQTALALGAKACAVFSALTAGLSVIGLAYLGYDALYAVFADF